MQRNSMKYLASMVQTVIDRREIRWVSAPTLAASLFDLARRLVERLLGWKEFQVRGEIAFATDLLWQGIGTGTPTRRQR